MQGRRISGEGFDPETGGFRYILVDGVRAKVVIEEEPSVATVKLAIALLTPGMAAQKREFDAYVDTVILWKNQPTIVDDEYPEWRFKWEKAVDEFLRARKANQPERFKSATRD